MTPRRTLPLALLLAAVLVGCGQRGETGTGPEAVATDPTAGLARIEWQLAEVVGPDSTWAVQSLDSVLRFDGQGGWSAQACNTTDGTADHGDGWVELTRGTSTLIGCEGEQGRLERAVTGVLDGRVEFELADGALRLGPDGQTQLVYRERPSIYPELSARTLLAGERGQEQFRVALSGTGRSLALHLEARPAPGTGWGTNSFGSPEPELEPGLWTSGALPVGDEQLLAGFAPSGTTRVTHRAGPGAATTSPLTVQDVPGSPWVVWHGFVEAHPPTSSFTAYAGDGTVLKTW